MLSTHVDTYQETDKDNVKHTHKKVTLNYLEGAEEEIERRASEDFFSLWFFGFKNLVRVLTISGSVFLLIYLIGVLFRNIV